MLSEEQTNTNDSATVGNDSKVVVDMAPIKEMVYNHYSIKPFENPSLSDIEKYDDQEKTTCPKCNRNRKYYCCDCCVSLIDNPPTIDKLPLHCVILQHKLERKSKSTAIQAKIVSNDNVDLYEFPNIPSEINKENAILLYPSKNAINLKDLKQSPNINLDKLKYVVFIDSTWKQAKQIYRDDRVSELPCAIISNADTLFWRFQNEGQKFLATIEAIFYFYREYASQVLNEDWNEKLKNLLYYYIHQYCLIQEQYIVKHPNWKFTHRKLDNDAYIKYDLIKGSNSTTDNNKSEEEPPLKKIKE
ncbi:hypothetical protein ABK040_005436 [Willaertia magna]